MPKRRKKENISNINVKSNLSYEKYLQTALEMISPKLSVRSYKLAPKDEYTFFERGRDIRVGIFWDGKPAIDSNGQKYEFVVEVPFWKSSNTNKEDREWMRNHADVHIKIFKDAVDRGKEKIKKSKPKKVSTKKDTSDGQIGSTQTLFEKEKQK